MKGPKSSSRKELKLRTTYRSTLLVQKALELVAVIRLIMRGLLKEHAHRWHVPSEGTVMERCEAILVPNGVIASMIQ